MLGYLDVTLPQSTISYGRIYFAASDARFFPNDSFSDRSNRAPRVVDVTFIAGADRVETDIRHLSSVRIGPRKSFESFLRSIKARAGGTLRVKRLEERLYELEYLG